MAYAEIYRQQIALLVRILPFVAEENCLALKGGTAINLFVRNLPRLSVDIDLTYLPVADRASSLAGINVAMKRIAERISRAIPGVRITPAVVENTTVKLFIRANHVQIKIEVTPVLRGTVYPSCLMQVTGPVSDEFGFAETNVVSFADLYAGKIVAALDRQHPRDLFDVRDLLRNEGITEELRRAFIVYLISHDRPMAEVLASPDQKLDELYARGFDGMTRDPIDLEELVEAKHQLIDTVVRNMPHAHRDFLIAFKRGKPDWDLLGVSDAKDLPAVRWRQQNLDKVSHEKRTALIDALEKILRG